MVSKQQRRHHEISENSENITARAFGNADRKTKTAYTRTMARDDGTGREKIFPKVMTR